MSCFSHWSPLASLAPSLTGRSNLRSYKMKEQEPRAARGRTETRGAGLGAAVRWQGPGSCGLESCDGGGGDGKHSATAGPDCFEEQPVFRPRIEGGSDRGGRNVAVWWPLPAAVSICAPWTWPWQSGLTGSSGTRSLAGLRKQRLCLSGDTSNWDAFRPSTHLAENKTGGPVLRVVRPPAGALRCGGPRRAGRCAAGTWGRVGPAWRPTSEGRTLGRGHCLDTRG